MYFNPVSLIIMVSTDLSYSCLACWVKFSADDLLKYFSYFSQKICSRFQANCLQWRKFSIKSQILFSWKNQKNINLSPAEITQRVVKIEMVK